MNNVTLMGRLTKDPTQRFAQTANGNLELSGFVLAVDRRFKKDGEQQADFIRCQAFGKIAEVINKHCSKGSKICIQGHIQTGSYKNKDGQTVYTTDVIVDNMEFAESKKDNSSSQAADDEFFPIPDEVDDDGLPFK